MIRAAVAAVSVLVALAGCADRLVDVPTTRPAAGVVTLDHSGRCPSDTVLLGDDDPASGAGSIPPGLDGQVVLRCDVDYSTSTRRGGVQWFTVRQWQHPLTPQLRAALDLPDRELRRGGSACPASFGGTTAIYVVDGRDQAVRVLPPTDEPCRGIRDEVQALLPNNTVPPDETFRSEQAAR